MGFPPNQKTPSFPNGIVVSEVYIWECLKNSHRAPGVETTHRVSRLF